MVAQNMFARTFELRFRNFADFSSLLYFLVVFKILGQPCRCFFGVLSLASSPLLVIVIRRLLYVPYYATGSFNSSYIWSVEPTTH